MTTWLFDSKFSNNRNQLIKGKNGCKLQAIVLLGAPFRLDPEGGMKPMLKAYYGNPVRTREAEPTALMSRALQSLDVGEVASWPRIMTAVSELDPFEHIIQPGREFAELWQEEGGRGTYLEIKRHNHISPVLSLGTGITTEEAWGYDVGNWLVASQ